MSKDTTVLSEKDNALVSDAIRSAIPRVQEELGTSEPLDVKEMLPLICEAYHSPCPLLRNADKDLDELRFRKIFDVNSLDSRKTLLNDEYLGAIASLAPLAQKDGTVTIPGGLIPQNWNGNRYQGTSCITLQVKMLTHKKWLPVFLSTDQMKKLALTRNSDATINSVLHKMKDSSKLFRHIAWNVSDLNFEYLHPRHSKAMATFFAPGKPQLTPEGEALVKADGKGRSVEAIVREMVVSTDTEGQRPRFNGNLSDRERDVLKNLTNDLATMSICSQLGAESHVWVSDILSMSRKSFSIPYPVFDAVKYAGRITHDIDQKLHLLKARGQNMDTVVNKVNREIRREQSTGKTKGMTM